jgi:hypothetical protein
VDEKEGVDTDATNEGPWPPVCEHCGDPERPDNPVQSCWFEGDEHLLHAGCQREWMGDDLSIPAFLRRVSREGFGRFTAHARERWTGALCEQGDQNRQTDCGEDDYIDSKKPE